MLWTNKFSISQEGKINERFVGPLNILTRSGIEAAEIDYPELTFQFYRPGWFVNTQFD